MQMFAWLWQKASEVVCSKQNFPIGNCHMAPSVMIRDEDTNGLMSQL